MKNNNNNKKSTAVDKTALQHLFEQDEVSNILMSRLLDKNKELEEIKSKVGRKSHKPTPELRIYVRINAGFGVPHAVIADGLGMSEDTLRKHYKAELSAGKLQIASAIVKTLAMRALMGDMKAIELYVRTQLKWSNSIEDAASSAEERAKVIDARLMESFNLIQTPEQEQDNKEDEDDEDLF